MASEPVKTPVMVISCCRFCGSRWFPARDVCSACAHDQLDRCEAGANAVAYASSVVRIGPEGFSAPYVLSYVDFDGVRALVHTDPRDPANPQPLPPDTPVTFTSGPIGVDRDVQLTSYRVRAIDPEGAGS